MKRAMGYNMKRSGAALAVLLCFGFPSFATDSVSTDAAKSLNSVLKKAGEQGFIAYEPKQDSNLQSKPSQSDNSAPRQPLNANEAKPAKDEMSHPLVQKNCKITSGLNLGLYQTVTTYDDIAATKSGFKQTQNTQDTLALAKTYISLGLGAEATALVEKLKSQDAKLVLAMSRVVSKAVTAEDQRLFQTHKTCNQAAEFWALFAKSIAPHHNPYSKITALDRDILKHIEDLPIELAKVASLNLGIFAADIGDIATAERLLIMLAPETKYGKLPKDKADGLLYLFAHVRQAKGDNSVRQIFKRLAQYDGLYRVRALQQMAQEAAQGLETHYPGFSEDLNAVSQQYNGHSQSRLATLEVIKYRVQADQFVDAIESSKREFRHDDPERMEAVSFIASNLNLRLMDEVRQKRLYALNGYLHDLNFFELYEDVTSLANTAIEAAVDLNLPELARHISTNSGVEQNLNQQRLDYALAKSELKSGHYKAAIKTAHKHADDPIFNNLILEASSRSGDREQALEALRKTPANALRFKRQAEMAWQKGHWGEAKIALEALAHNNPDKTVADKMAIVDFVSRNTVPHLNSGAPDMSAELDGLMEQLSNDAAIVKAYLNHG